MKTYVVYNNEGEYLTPDGSFTKDIAGAKEYKVKWLIELLKIILDILLAFGITDKVKYKLK